MLIDNEFTKITANLTLSDNFKKAITRMYEEFVLQVMIDLTTFKYEPTEYSAFVDLNLVSKEYALQKYFEPRLDTYIRDYLIYGVIEAILENSECSVYKPSLPDEYCEIDKYYSTVDYEKIVGFEFVIIKSRKIGYRFTSIQDYQAEQLIKNVLIDEIVIIDWENPHGISIEEKEKKYWGPYGHYIKVVGSEDVFIELFGDEEGKAYNLFLKHAITKFRDVLGISSIPKLTAPMLFQHRLEEEKLLKELTSDENLRYMLIEIENEVSYPNIEMDSNRLIQKSGLFYKFIKHKLYKALVGTSDYAKSFLTSEYLYHQFSNNDMFDYTAIVSGYLKSVEQLMYQIILQYTDKRDKNGKLYRVGSRSNKTTLTSDHLSNHKIVATMGNLIYFFKDDYPETINIEDANKAVFINCLELYLSECRNQSFHKHNNYDWNRVERIRNNTFVMYLLLLGACASEDDEKNIKHFSIVRDDRLERLYYCLRQKEMYTFKIKMPNEDKYLYATRIAEREFPSFTEYGLLDNFSIQIRCTEKLSSPMAESRDLVITRECIPDEVFYTTYVSEYQIDYSL